LFIVTNDDANTIRQIVREEVRAEVRIEVQGELTKQLKPINKKLSHHPPVNLV
jgi:hypothetical protein